ncbi:MAG: hypothetical protein ABI165_18060 [Bryobacteraceae bacterium]
MPVFPMRAKVGMVLLGAIAVASILTKLADTYGQYAQVAGQPSSIPAFTTRFDALRKALPAEGVIGYITDHVGDPNQAIAEYYITQYALAPVLVTNSFDQKFVVGNFHGAMDPAAIKTKGLEFVRDFGNGVELLRNPSR